MAAIANTGDDVSKPADVPPGRMMAKGRDRRETGARGAPEQGVGGLSLFSVEGFAPLDLCVLQKPGLYMLLVQREMVHPRLRCMADHQGKYPRLLRDLCASRVGEGGKHPTTWGDRGRRRDRKADGSGQPFTPCSLHPSSPSPFLCQHLPGEVPPRSGSDLSR